jgi:hypothetical protein
MKSSYVGELQYDQEPEPMSDYPNVSDLIKDNHKKEKKNVIGGRCTNGDFTVSVKYSPSPKKISPKGFPSENISPNHPKKENIGVTLTPPHEFSKTIPEKESDLQKTSEDQTP